MIGEVLERNARYAESFDTGGPHTRSKCRLAVVACMDARLDTHRLLGLAEGDAHVIRNAGGVVSDDVVRSLVISSPTRTGSAASSTIAPPAGSMRSPHRDRGHAAQSRYCLVRRLGINSAGR